MIAVADGDRAAFAPLFAALWPMVSQYCIRQLGDTALGEDCAQDTLGRVFAAAHQFDRERDVLTWALTIATWQVRTLPQLRRRRREAFGVQVAEPTIDGAMQAERRDLIASIAEAAQSLSRADAAIVAAAVLEDNAGQSGAGAAAQRKRLSRALERLRMIWRTRNGTT